ncbi:MFS transporter [Sideroxydans lithotrophicus]|uniref:Major facilitator superfamily MFS_1 n=1 Tax=Sideroxydans lithotrophicus (strain ES-1) TaxID=580332 RepID=D5CLH4_SIDLE|nr:MFS transporter [Sideroxydans lithotrophicus]ADE10562.1 major facilitator superfamily MFS_1 [Sideroxydans lithotrophicus ES-1]
MPSLKRSDYRTLALAALGGTLEFYDFIIFVFFAGAISKLFFPHDMPDWLSQTQTFGIFAAGYLARPLGGIIMAHFGDLFGRKRMFMLSILLMALPTLAIGLLPTYAAIGIWAPLLLLALRVFQGAAIGGEVPGAWVFVAEHVPQRHVGFACGTLTAGLTGGILLGSLVATAVIRSYTPAELLADGWRMPFILGGAFGLVSVWLRQYLHETPVFKEMQARQQLASELPLKTVVRAHRPAVVLTMLMTWLLSAAIVVMILMTPTLVQKLFAIPAAVALQSNSIATLFLSIGCIAFGALADRFGAGRVLAAGCMALGASSWLLYSQLSAAPEHIYVLYALNGFFVGVIGVVPSTAVRLFPPAVRFSGLSFAYNVAYAVFGGLTPVLVSLMLGFDSFAPVHYVVALSVVGIGLGVYLRRREVVIR